MSELTSVFSDIATSIRGKLEIEDTMKPGQMSGYINSIPKPLKSDTPVYTITVADISDETNADNLFANNTNQVTSYPSITFGATVTSVNNTFLNCQIFNAPVYFDSPSNITAMDNTFNGCRSFNQPITIPTGVVSMNNTFRGCNNLKQPVTLPSTLKTMDNTFYAYYGYGVGSFHSSLPEGIEDMYNVFENVPLPFYKLPKSLVNARNISSSGIHEPYMKLSENTKIFDTYPCGGYYVIEGSDNLTELNSQGWSQIAGTYLMGNTLSNFRFTNNGTQEYPYLNIAVRNINAFMDAINEAYPNTVWVDGHRNSYDGQNEFVLYNYKRPIINTEDFKFNSTGICVISAPNVHYVDSLDCKPDINSYVNYYKIVISKNLEGNQIPFQTFLPEAPYLSYQPMPQFNNRFPLIVEFENGYKDLSNMFNGLSNNHNYFYAGNTGGSSFNIVFVIPEGVTNVSHMFDYARFAGPGRWTGQVDYCSFSFGFVLPNTVKDMSYMCSNRNTYNSYRGYLTRIVIPDSVTNASHAFQNVSDIGLSDIYLGNGIVDASYMFNYTNLSGNITIPLSIVNASHMLGPARYSPIVVNLSKDSKIKDMSYMFAGVYNLNTYSNIAIPSGAENLSHAFASVKNFTPNNMIIPNTAKDLSAMFQSSNYMGNITIPNGVENVANMFMYVGNFNTNLTIPATVKDSSYMLYSCANFNDTVVFEGYPENTDYMFAGIKANLYDKITFNVDACTGDAGGILRGYTNGVINLPNTFSALTRSFSGVNDAFVANVNLAEYPNLESVNYTFSETGYNFAGGIEIPSTVKYASGTFQRSSITGDVTLHEGLLDTSWMFANTWNYNRSVSIPSTVTELSGMFASSQNFNTSITIPDSAVNIDNMFVNCQNFNQSIVIPANVENMAYTFSYSNFNQPIVIPQNVKNMAYTFSSSAYNQDLTIPEGVEDISGMLQSSNFNANLNILGTITNISSLFEYSAYNQIFNIPDSVVDASNLYQSTSMFNKPVTIPANVINASSMFEYSQMFNSPVVIEEGVENLSSMFRQAVMFNQPITIPSSATNVQNMFEGAWNFNSPVNVPENLNISWLLNSTNFNQPFTFPQNVTDISGLFNGSAFNQELIIPNTVENCDYLLSNAFENRLVIGTNVTHMNSIFGDSYGSYVNDITCYATGIQFAYSAFSGLAEFEGGITLNSNNMWGDYLFSGCQFLDNITINGDVSSAASMFHSCASLTEVHLSGNYGNGYYREYDEQYNQWYEYYGDCSFMFANCLMFNSDLNDVKFFGNCAYMFAGSTRFSQPLNLYYANNTSNLFQMSGHYESLPAGIFNAPVVLSNQGDCDMKSMFAGCSRFNQSITIPSNAFQYDNTNSEEYSVQNAYSAYMFADCARFNSPVTIENGVKYIPMLFASSNFNQPIVIPDSVKDVRNMFEYDNAFNSSVTIGNGVEMVDSMFMECERFNSPITFNNGITNLSGLFRGSSAYNQPTIIPDSVINISNMFASTNYNQSVTIGNGVQDMSNAFCYTNFNQPVNIPSNVTNCYNAFHGCYNFNCPVNIEGNSPNLASMFQDCSNFNSIVNISSASDCSFMFYDCTNFNQPIDITLLECNSLGYMFNNCVNLAQPVNINVNNCSNLVSIFDNTQVNEVNVSGNNLVLYGIGFNSNANFTLNGSNLNAYRVLNSSSYSSGGNASFVFAPECTNVETAHMLDNYYWYNTPVIMDGVKFTNCSYMFNNCINFNQPIGTPDTLGDCSYMFFNCQNFNQPINITSATNCYNMFYKCTNFNQPLVIGDDVDTTWILYNCTNFNSPITFGNNCRIWSPFEVSNFNSDIRIKGLNSNCSWLVYNCNSFGANIYIDWIGNNAALVNCISNKTNSISKSFHVTSEATDFMLNQNLVYAGSQVKPTYEALGDGNGYFNAAYNIYIYNNYIPA